LLLGKHKREKTLASTQRGHQRARERAVASEKRERAEDTPQREKRGRRRRREISPDLMALNRSTSSR